MSEFVDLYDRNRKFLNRVVDRNTYLFQPGEFMMYVLAILENEEGKFVRRERYLGECSRSFYIGDDIKDEDIKASFKNGTLQLEIPKKEEKKELPEKRYIPIGD